MPKVNEQAGDPFSVRARLKSFSYAGRGLRTMLATQHNAWIHAVASVAVITAEPELRSYVRPELRAAAGVTCQA